MLMWNLVSIDSLVVNKQPGNTSNMSVFIKNSQDNYSVSRKPFVISKQAILDLFKVNVRNARLKRIRSSSYLAKNTTSAIKAESWHPRNYSSQHIPSNQNDSSNQTVNESTISLIKVRVILLHFKSDDRKNERLLYEIWMTLLAILCFFVTILLIFTYCLDTSRFKYPEKPIIYYSGCYWVYSIAYLIRKFMFMSSPINSSWSVMGQVDSAIFSSSDRATWLASQGSFSTNLHATLSNKNGSNVSCLQINSSTTLLVLLYYFEGAASLWWVVLTISWFLAAVKKWGHEAIRNLNLLFHLVCWITPAIFTIALLLLTPDRNGEDVTGITKILNQNKNKIPELDNYTPKLELNLLNANLSVIDVCEHFFVLKPGLGNFEENINVLRDGSQLPCLFYCTLRDDFPVVLLRTLNIRVDSDRDDRTFYNMLYLMPTLVSLVIGSVFIFMGIVSIQRLKKVIKISHSNALKLERLSFKTSLFAVLYLLFKIVLVINVIFHDYFWAARIDKNMPENFNVTLLPTNAALDFEKLENNITKCDIDLECADSIITPFNKKFASKNDDLRFIISNNGTCNHTTGRNDRKVGDSPPSATWRDKFNNSCFIIKATTNIHDNMTIIKTIKQILNKTEDHQRDAKILKYDYIIIVTFPTEKLYYKTLDISSTSNQDIGKLNLKLVTYINNSGGFHHLSLILFFSLFSGIFAGIWVFNTKTLRSWSKFFKFIFSSLYSLNANLYQKTCKSIQKHPQLQSAMLFCIKNFNKSLSQSSKLNHDKMSGYNNGDSCRISLINDNDGEYLQNHHKKDNKCMCAYNVRELSYDAYNRNGFSNQDEEFKCRHEDDAQRINQIKMRVRHTLNSVYSNHVPNFYWSNSKTSIKEIRATIPKKYAESLKGYPICPKYSTIRKSISNFSLRAHINCGEMIDYIKIDGRMGKYRKYKRFAYNDINDVRDTYYKRLNATKWLALQNRFTQYSRVKMCSKRADYFLTLI
ncbi:unnamed protein product [Gordionus sp. m RMFG-2023]